MKKRRFESTNYELLCYNCGHIFEWSDAFFFQAFEEIGANAYLQYVLLSETDFIYNKVFDYVYLMLSQSLTNKTAFDWCFAFLKKHIGCILLLN